MSGSPEAAIFIVGLMTAGTGGLFLWHDRGNPASHALSLCLIAIGLRLLFDDAQLDETGAVRWLTAALLTTLESLAIFAGIEWGRRIGQTAQQRLRHTINGLFIAAQILVVVYWGLNLGYLAIAPEQATSDVAGTFRVRAIEFAIFAPILGVSILLTGIAITILIALKVDPVETVRLRALSIAGPFLLAGLVLNESLIPITLTLGLLIFLSGSMRYLIMQNRRGQFMSQFLSPEVARMVRLEGMDRTLQRERRLISVVACDLRGFTAYARRQDSDAVVSLLERYYDVVGRVAEEHDGTIKDHAGDGVLILIGAPLPVAEHSRSAIRLALELMQAGKALLAEHAPELGLGIGVTTGHVTVGAIRGARRLEYVAVGNPVNLAARLCDRAADGEILADLRSVQALTEEDGVQSQERPPEPLKGFPEPIPVCALTASGSLPAPPAERRRRKRRRLRPGKGRRKPA